MLVLSPRAARSHTDQKAQGGLTYQLTPDGFSTWKVLPGHNQTTRGGTKATQSIHCQVLHWDFTKPRGRAREISTDQLVPVAALLVACALTTHMRGRKRPETPNNSANPVKSRNAKFPQQAFETWSQTQLTELSFTKKKRTQTSASAAGCLMLTEFLACDSA